MINIIETMNLQQGGIYFLKDYKPTGDYKRHNYIVLTPSDKIPYVNQIICIGITSCRHGGEGVIPIKCTNGDTSYIDLSRIYIYNKTDMEKPICHGFIDIELANSLLLLAMFELGLPLSGKKEMKAIDFYYRYKTNVPSSSSNSIQKIEKDDNIVTIDADNSEEENDDKEVKETKKKPRLNYKNLYATELMSVFNEFKDGIETYANINNISVKGAYYRQKVLNRIYNDRYNAVKKSTTTPVNPYKNVGFWSDSDLVFYDNMVLSIMKDDKITKPYMINKIKERFNLNNIDEIMLKCKSVEKEMKRRNIDINKVVIV